MKKLHWKVLAGLVVGCVFLAQGAVAESETPSLRAQIDELFADRSHSDAPGLLEDGQSADYAAGLFVSDYGDETAFEHGGAWMGYRAQMSRFPERRLTVILLSNASSTGVSMSSIVDLLPRAERAAPESESPPFEPPSTIELPPDVLTGYEGDYWSDELERELRLQIEDETLHLAWADDARRVPMVQIGPDDFLARQFVAVPWNPQDVRILVERDDTHQVTGLSLSCDMVRGISFVKMDREQKEGDL